jgi:hypothetical protein
MVSMIEDTENCIMDEDNEGSRHLARSYLTMKLAPSTKKGSILDFSHSTMEPHTITSWSGRSAHYPVGTVAVHLTTWLVPFSPVC